MLPQHREVAAAANLTAELRGELFSKVDYALLQVNAVVAVEPAPSLGMQTKSPETVLLQVRTPHAWSLLTLIIEAVIFLQLECLISLQRPPHSALMSARSLDGPFHWDRIQNIAHRPDIRLAKVHNPFDDDGGSSSPA